MLIFNQKSLVQNIKKKIDYVGPLIRFFWLKKGDIYSIS